MEDNNILLDNEQLHYLLKGNATRIGNQNGWEPFITAFIFFISEEPINPFAPVTITFFIMIKYPRIH